MVEAMILSEYHETRFVPKEPDPSRWSEAFAVITACNPLGQGLDEETDRVATVRLRKTISRLGLNRHRVTGVSADLKHREPGFAVWGCDLPAALQLGSEFAQTAIYWIEDGKLDVVSCASGERQHVGLWSERLQTAGERDKCCCVYVIELTDEAKTVKKVQEANPNANPKMKCIYVGSTAKTPEERFKVHKAVGKQSSSIVRKYGRRLVPALYRDLPLMTRPAAERKEKQLAKQLRAKGYTVWQN
jgi:Protein of unknown function (DUF3293)